MPVESADRWLQAAVAAPAVLFLLFTAANPYLGLRTTGAFTMFSNLRTEAGATNHLVGHWPLADYQDELVLVTGSNVRPLADAADNGESIPVASFHGWSEAAESTPWATVEIDDREIRWIPADSDSLFGEPSFFERYLLSFRSIDPDGANPRCGN